MKILIELDVEDLEDRVSQIVRERQLSLDQLVIGLPMSRETARRVVVGNERSQLNSVILVCYQLGIDLREFKKLLLNALEREDFEAVIEKAKILAKNPPKKPETKKTKIRSRKSS